ncbi:MAG TPA: carboxypeptidase-like regulatory domain-containing protein [Terracidiphilus sp.]
MRSGADDVSQDQSPQSSNKGTCMISGTVLDANDDVIQGARVVLTGRSGAWEREMQSGPNGQFAFAALPAGSYKVTVTGKDMGTFVSLWLTLHPGEIRILSQVVLPVATATTNVEVNGNSQELKQELSEQQVQIAVDQRVWRVFPNFYSSYDWNAPPMEPKQKFQLAYRSMIDPMAFAGAAGVAGFEQFYNIFPGYGRGIAGYFKRYGAAYTNDFSARMLSSGVFATLFHQDPRYFYKGTGSFQSRAIYAVSCAFITRNDNGRRRPNYSHVLGVFASAALSNLYYPKDSRGLTLTLMNGAVETAGNSGTNIVREFILKGITSHAGGKN